MRTLPWRHYSQLAVMEKESTDKISGCHPKESADLISSGSDPLVKMLMAISATQDAILEDHLQCLQRLVRQIFRLNNAVQVINPTGNAAYLVYGSTAHSFLGIPTGEKSCNELTVPSGTNSAKVRKPESSGWWWTVNVWSRLGILLSIFLREGGLIAGCLSFNFCLVATALPLQL